MPDVSLVLALHREGHYLPRALTSLAEAAWYARGFGISTELVAVLDRSDSITEQALRRFDTAAFQQVTVLQADNGSLGPTRNDGCKAASGRYILTADGDDLVSFNTIERMFRQAELLGPRAILIPKFLFGFDASYFIAEYADLEQLSPLAMFASNPFVSRVFFHRSLLDRLAYHDVALTDGYAYEDWHFNCNAVAEGFTFHAVAETILFYRQRDGSLLTEGNRLSVRQIPPSRLFQPATYRRICAPWVERFSEQGDFRLAIRSRGKSVLRDLLYVELMLAANAIDPAIDPDRLADSPFLHSLGGDFVSAVAYYQLCAIVGDRMFDEVFLLPFMTMGGADRYVLDVIIGIAEQDPSRPILVLFGERCAHYSWLDRLPPSCLPIDLIATCPGLNAEARELICLKLLQSCAIGARLHLRPCPFALEFFARFAPVLRDAPTILYRFADARIAHGDLRLVHGWAFRFLATHLPQIDIVVSDSQNIIDADRRRFGVMPDKWQMLRSAIAMPERIDERTLAAGRASRSILWLSRIDGEKRPELLLRIAALLARRMPDVTMDVYGRPTLQAFDLSRFDALRNVRYRGSFERLEDVHAEPYYCFVYTSHFDGMPVVVLEMVAAGLAVIAPDVGAIGEMIENGETGVLLDCDGDDAADAERYVSAIGALFADPDHRDRMARRAFAVLRERYGMETHARRMAEIFDLPRVAEAVLVE